MGAPLLVGAPDPTALLNSLDKRRRESVISSAAAGDGNASAGVTAPPLDPIEFLNKHYTSEAVLVAQLPVLREAVSERMERLDDRISTALQRQSETADQTRKHVQEAKASVVALEHRVRQVKEKASLSEKAVLEITKDMKRLDCAKRHLQRTITTLKQLHMLINAVEQLRVSTITGPFPDYKTAAQLVDATRLLLKHFDGYNQKVQPMRLLSNKVVVLQDDLRTSLIRGFRIAAFGVQKAKEMEGLVKIETKPPPKKKSSFLSASMDEDEDEDAEKEQDDTPVMTPDIMEGGVLLIDAMGETVRTRFIHEFCQDHLSGYLKEFEPPSKEPVGGSASKQPEKRISSFKVQPQAEEKADDEKAAAGLESIEKRFIWFREVVQQVERTFPKVFPSYWNLQASLARHFLQLVSRDGHFSG